MVSKACWVSSFFAKNFANMCHQLGSVSSSAIFSWQRRIPRVELLKLSKASQHHRNLALSAKNIIVYLNTIYASQGINNWEMTCYFPFKISWQLIQLVASMLSGTCCVFYVQWMDECFEKIAPLHNPSTDSFFEPFF